jgi:hypothetical protein
MNGVRQLGRVHINNLASILVCPTTVVSERGSSFHDIKRSSNRVGFSIIEGFKSGEFIGVFFNEFCNLDKDLASFLSRDVLCASNKRLAGYFERNVRIKSGLTTPNGLMSLVSRLDSCINISLVTCSNLSNNLAIYGVDNIERCSGLGIHELTADEETGRKGRFALVDTASGGKVVFKGSRHCVRFVM